MQATIVKYTDQNSEIADQKYQAFFLQFETILITYTDLNTSKVVFKNRTLQTEVKRLRTDHLFKS